MFSGLEIIKKHLATTKHFLGWKLQKMPGNCSNYHALFGLEIVENALQPLGAFCIEDRKKCLADLRWEMITFGL